MQKSTFETAQIISIFMGIKCVIYTCFSMYRGTTTEQVIENPSNYFKESHSKSFILT